MDSIQHMKKSLETAEGRMGDLMSKYKWKPNEVSFIRDAATTIMECRRLLAWTYPIGYYMEKGFSYRHLFLDYQQNLEKFQDNPNARAEIINYQRVIHKYRDNLLKGIE